MRHLFYLHNLPLPDKVAAQKKMKNKILARLYIYFPYGEISNKRKIKNKEPFPRFFFLVFWQLGIE